MVDDIEPAPDYHERLKSDKPLTSPENGDSLNYGPFAKHLALNLVEVGPTDGLVVALFGTWGMGKSTMLNFVKFYLEQLFDIRQGEGSRDVPIIMEFNPWWFSDSETLTKAFIAQLTETIAPHVSDQDNLRKTAEKLGELASGFGLKGANKIGKLIGEYNSGVSDLKARISKILENDGRRLIVIMDDIDRLPVNEIREIFRLIKAVADLPNIMYLLAFDHEIVAEALNKEYGLSGAAFLGKIIQVPVALPIPDAFDLKFMSTKHLASIVKDEDIERLDTERWPRIFEKGIAPFLSTPRNVIRFRNALAISYPKIAGEVNVADFLALEALRVFSTRVYDHVKNCRPEFIELPHSPFVGTSDEEQLRHFHRNWANQCLAQYLPHEVKAIRLILTSLFPIFSWAMSDGPFDLGMARNHWRAQLRVCSEEMFDTYFQFSVGKRSISMAELNELVESANNRDLFQEKLTKFGEQPDLPGVSRMAVVLSRLLDMTWKEMSPGTNCCVILSLLDVGDTLGNVEDTPPFDVGNAVRMQWLLMDCLQGLSPEERVRCLLKGVTDGRSLTFAVQIVHSLEKQADEGGFSEDQLISEADLKELQSRCLAKIKTAADKRTLLHAPDLWYVLYAWKDWESIDTVRGWLSDQLQLPENMILFLRGFLPDEQMKMESRKILRLGKYFDRIVDLINIENFKPVLDELQAMTTDDLDRKRIEFVRSAHRSDSNAELHLEVT